MRLKLQTLFLSIVFMLSVTVLSAQHFMHAYGGSISMISGGYVTSTTGWTSKFSMAQTYFTYFPRYNFLERPNSSVSVGIPIGLGFGFAHSVDGSDVGTAFAYDLPVVVDYNIGCKATKEVDKHFGGYFGLGFGYANTTISNTKYSNGSYATYGLLLRAGMRFAGVQKWNGKGLTFGIYTKNGMEKENYSTFGFNILVDL